MRHIANPHCAVHHGAGAWTTYFGLFGGRPELLLHGDDLPTAATFASWAGRFGGVSGVGVGSPVPFANGWLGDDNRVLKGALLRSQYVTANAEAANYTASTSFTWAGAIRLKASSAQRNVMFLGHTSNANNFRGLYVSTAGKIGIISNRNGAGAEVDDTPADAITDRQVIFVASYDAATGLFRVTQLDSSNVATEAVSTAQATGGTLSCNVLSIGAAVLNGATSSQSPMFVRMIAARRGFIAHSLADRPAKIARHMRDRLRCPLPAPDVADISKSLTTYVFVERWFNAALQAGAYPLVDDFSKNNTPATIEDSAYTGKAFDFLDNAGADIVTGYSIPAGSAPFTLVFSVSRVAGRTWDTSTNLNWISSPNIMVSSFVYQGKASFHVNGVLYQSTYDVVGTWADGERHVGALVVEGSTARLYIDDPNTPVDVRTGVAAREFAAAMHCGGLNGINGSWEHKAKDFMILSKAVDSTELEQIFRTVAAHSYNLVWNGDSNVARFVNDMYAPAGVLGVFDQCKDRLFPEAGLRTRFANFGFSGRMWDTAGGLAPVSMIAGGAAMDATLSADDWNVGLWCCGTNDVHQSLYPGVEVATIAAKAQQFVQARTASGKYVAQGLCIIVPSTNATFNARINAVNDAYRAMVGTDIDFVIERGPYLDDPSDGIHWEPKAGSSDPEHPNGEGARRWGQQIRNAVLNSIPYIG